MRVIRTITIEGNPFYMGILKRHERKIKELKRRGKNENDC